MVTVSFSLNEDYWQNFELHDEDIEFIYNYLLEFETPLTPQELVAVLVDERIRYEKFSIEQQRSSGGDLYQPKGSTSPIRTWFSLPWAGSAVKSYRSVRGITRIWVSSR